MAGKVTYSLVLRDEYVEEYEDRKEALQRAADHVLAHPEDLNELEFRVEADDLKKRFVVSGSELEQFLQDSGYLSES